MAWEKIYSYTTKLHQRIQHFEKLLLDEANPTARIRLRAKADEAFRSLLEYYETVLSTGKFVDQRRHCREVIEQINPSFCDGYFKTMKK